MVVLLDRNKRNVLATENGFQVIPIVCNHSGQQADMGEAGNAYRTWHIEASGIFDIFVYCLYSKGKAYFDDKDHLSVHINYLSR